MNRIKGQALGVRSFIILFLLFVFSPLSLPAGKAGFTLSPTLAAESSASADSLRQQNEASIRSKIESLKQEIASKAAKYKQEITQKLQNKAYIGSIKAFSEQSITLTSNDTPLVVKINQDTIYESNVNKKYTFKNLEQEDYIAALGDIDETNVLTAKKIIELPQSTKIIKFISWGQILELSGKIVIKTNDDKRLTLTVDSDTTYQKGENEISFEDIRINDQLVVVGVINKAGSVVSQYIYIFPKGTTTKPQKLSTPSAQITTSSAKKK